MMTGTKRAMAAFLGGVLLFTAASFAQGDVLSVTGNVKQPLKLTTADLEKMPRAVAATINSGVVTTFEGVWLNEILKKAGFPPGEDLAGYVLASAADGYRVVFSLGELDPTVSEGEFLVADKANGKPLSGRDGTFRLVAAKDVRAVRSVRQLARLEVVLLSSQTK
jgi:DMSO/TMAO reductase YedYZ molybdopterin-dependent catalytic subunit